MKILLMFVNHSRNKNMQNSHTISLLRVRLLPQDLEHESCLYLYQPAHQLKQNQQ